MIVAVDGTAASGKGTLAKSLAKKLRLKHLDTGILYRIIGFETFKYINCGKTLGEKALKSAKELNFDKVNNFNSNSLRTAQVGEAASLIAQMPKVREELIDFQRDYSNFDIKTFNGAILDGRDIGSIILPNADFKFFLDANVEVRAQRRTQELIALGYQAIFREVLKDIKTRDKRDKNREIAPLLKTKNAIYIDSSDFSVNEMLKIALNAILGV